ncbi:hypothetical protein MKS88_005040 [Plasmodium brasilianum]|uniref:DEK C-terminal domain-containing protein n=2 Tax=Plasmodium (Plasmodium) TaxID=418103 RepID=A0A1A8WN63_PLAMA|nr:conserved Plasmodium protein, unknown function [Plasmodium malariae]KAI4835823.1 hypothetical protein MKS88_005040 [Plasmodium brasilianum]SBS93293.1 conserved Plasmodium protein, unknown function [Plasmodium malariae]SBT72347.1 conserved Plasmodium protein, unknown function [Plasmodium malariae]SCP02760.1 conserved Plasmodium protein, unknown function [Plasmodium malariae]
MSVEDITTEQLEDATKSFVSIESATQISRRFVRKKLEEIFNLEENALYERKKEINDIVEKVLINLLQEENKKKNDDLRIKDEDMNSVETNDDGDENSILANSSKMNSNQRNKNRSEEVKNENSIDDKSLCAQSDSNDNKNSSKKRKKGGNESLSARKKQANVMTKDYFLDSAKTLLCNISENIKLKLEPRIFSTGSCGWHIMDKVYLLVGDHNVLCQLCINCSVIGSKQWN